MKKNKNRNYMFTNKRHSKKAIMSTVFGTLSLFFMILVSILSYKLGGDVPSGFGFTGIFATAFAGIGMYLGVISVKEYDRYKLFGVIGIVLNGITLGFVSLILYMGAYLS